MDEIAKHMRRLKKRLPEECEFKIIQTGFNVRYGKKTVSFHYKHGNPIGGGKAVHLTNSVRFVEQGELEVWKYLVKYKDPEDKIEEAIPIPVNNKTQICIDHINRKIVLMKKNLTHNNNQAIVHLKNLVEELKQYL